MQQKEKSNICDDSIANLRNDNASLIAKIEKLNASLTSLKNENEKLIAKAKDLDVCNTLLPILEMRMLFYMLRLLN
jgi:chromosome segregation ATPase